MKLKYLTVLPIIYYLAKYFLYKLNLKLLFKENQKILCNNINYYKDFIKIFYNYNVFIHKFKIRCEGDYLDSLYIKNKKKTDYITIYFHGNRGTIYDCLYKNDVKNILSYSNLFLYDYRGYGESSGHTNEINIIEDSILIYIYVLKTLNYDPSKIIIYGNSLGGYVASTLIKNIKLANLPIPKGLIIQSPFYSLYEICADIYPLLKYFMQFNLNNSENINKICDLLPIIILHSKNHEYIKFKHSQKLLEDNKNNASIKLLEIDGLHDVVFYDNTINDNIKSILGI